MKDKQIWRFTFGKGQQHAGHCQPIKASSHEAARTKMFELYGSEWCFQYSEQQWQEVIDNPMRFWPMEEELPLIEVENKEEESEDVTSNV